LNAAFFCESGGCTQESYPRNFPRLLGVSREWRGQDAPTHAADERSPVHYRMISSARTNSDCGIVRPSALAVLRLITNSNLVGCSTGRSAGFGPLLIFFP